jgi:hypothetical protein
MQLNHQVTRSPGFGENFETMLPVFEAQLLTCLKLAKKRLGLLINFNVPKITGRTPCIFCFSLLIFH